MAKARRRFRRIVALNQLLRRHEKGFELELMQVTRWWGRQVAARWTMGNDAVLDELQLELQRKLQPILYRRLKIIAHAFGKHTLDRIEEAIGGAKMSIWERFTGRIENWLTSFATSKSVYISKSYEQRARDVLTDGFRQGLGEASTQRRLRDVLAGDIGVNAARRIARTETHTAASVGADAAARERGIEMVKEWGATEDARTRPDHAAANGQTVGMDEFFEVGGESLEFPGDPNGSAEQIINCRCVVLYNPVIDGEVLR